MIRPNDIKSFVGGVIAFKALPRPQFATLQTATFPVYFTMQTILPAVLALTFPGARTAIGTRDVSGLSGVMHVTNRWAVLAPIATVCANVSCS